MGTKNQTTENNLDTPSEEKTEEPEEVEELEETTTTQETSEQKTKVKSIINIPKIKKDEKISIPQYYSEYKSIMYKPENLKKLVQILHSLNKGKIIEQEEKQEEIISETTTTIFDETTVSVYLNSILFISNKLWSVWANEVKISNINNGEGELKVLSLNANKAKFLWTINMTKWEIINANDTIPDDVYTIKDNQVHMQFTLQPNQSFIPALNQIIEGRLVKETREEGEIGEEGTTETERETLTPDSGVDSLDIFL